ncbi:MAG: MucBP domain-containing protein [Clostridia bacterium]|nr:MucBP domain-containing protein [Clostridia bacterium]
MKKEGALTSIVNSIKNNKAIAVMTSIIVIFISVVVISAVYLTKTKSALTEADLRKNAENQVALSYGIATEDTESQYVKFSAFFTREVNGKAEKLAGTCKDISEKDTLYIDINVLSDGYVEDGAVITVEGANFAYKVNVPADEIIKTSVISDNATVFPLKQINAGTQKIIQGDISADLGDNVNNYSKEVTVKLTGTHVSNDGTRTPLNVEKKITVDWYGDLETDIYVYQNNSDDNNEDNSIYYYRNDLKDKSIAVSFAMDETQKELLLKENSIDVTIPFLNEKAPEKVSCINSDVSIVKIEETENMQKYRLTKNAIVGNDNVITKKLSDENTYTILIQYPQEAYEAINDETTLELNVNGYYIAYNNPDEELNFYKDSEIATNESKSNVAEKTIKVIIKNVKEIEQGKIDFDVTILNKKYNEKSNCFIISKETLEKLLDEENTDKFEYKVEWAAIVNGKNENSIIKMSEGNAEEIAGQENEEYGDTFNQKFIEKYIINKGIYFENVEEVLGTEGKLSVYNNDTNELIKELTMSEIKTYTAENPLMFDNEVKHIRIETTQINNSENKILKVVLLKEINKELFKQDYTKEEVENIEILNTKLEGTVESVSTTDETQSTITIISYDSVYMYNKISYAELEVETKQISTTQVLNNEKIFIKTIVNDNEFESNWKNGKFAVEIPEQISAIKINSITANNNVTIESYELNKVDGKNILKIKTTNENPSTFTITIDCDIAPDYKIGSITNQFKLYYYNELTNRYYNLEEDKYDVNDNTSLDENIGLAIENVEFVSAQELITYETVSNYTKVNKESSEWSDQKVVAPEIALVDNKEGLATINVVLKNGYENTIKNVKVIGRIPFTGNKSIIEQNDLKSSFTVTMGKDGINIPEDLKGKIDIYYTNNENADADLEKNENNWRKLEDISNQDELNAFISEIKSYLIDFKSTEIASDKEYEFSYEVKIPETVEYNKISYSNHAVYYNVETEDGMLQLTTAPAKLGIKSVCVTDLEIKTFEKGTDTLIKPIFYQLSWQEEDENENVITKSTTLSANDDRIIYVTGLHRNIQYSLQQISIDKDYQINSEVITFIANNQFEESITGTVRKAEASEDVLKLEIENTKILKYNFKVNKVDENGNELTGATFTLKSNDGFQVTKIDNTFSDLYRYAAGNDKSYQYTLEETAAPTGYLPINTKLRFRAYNDENGKLKLEILSGGDLIRTNHETGEKEISIDGDTISINVENRIGGEFTLTKVDKTDGKALQGVKYVIYSVKPSKEVIDFAKDVNGNYIGTKQSNRYVTTTDNNGKIVLQLLPGYYKAVEIQTTYEYKLEANENLRTVYFEIKDEAENKNEYFNNKNLQYEEGTIVEISTIEELKTIANKVNSNEDSYAGKTIKLINDLDFNNSDENMATIGTEYSFKGNFDGNNHAIKNLSSESMSSLFGKVENSYIKDLTIENCNFNLNNNYEVNAGLIKEVYDSKICSIKITGNGNIECGNMSNYGTIAAYAKDSIIDRCINERDILIGKLGADAGGTTEYIGGIVGHAENCYILKCNNSGNIKTSGSTYKLGGIAGVMQVNGIIEDCSNTGNLNSEGSNEIIGGIVSGTSEKTMIKNCYNTGDVATNAGSYGIAYTLNNSQIIGCYNTGYINAPSNASGIVYTMNNGKIVKCYNAGYIKASSSAAGIANSLRNSTVRESYNEGKIEAYGQACGIAYEINNSQMIECYNSGILNMAAFKSGIGYNASQGSVILNCYNDAEISECFTIGIVYSATDSYIEGCYNNKNLYPTYQMSASIANSISNTTVNNCYNLGNINAINPIAGVIYQATNGSKVVNCYNKGTIESTNNASGIVYYIEGAKVYNCYNAGNISGKTAAGIIYDGSRYGTSEIKNCYNVGKIKATATNGLSMPIAGIAYKFDNSYSIDNCYYLDSTANVGVLNPGNGVNEKCESISYDTASSEKFVKQLNKNQLLISNTTNLFNWKYNGGSEDYKYPTLISNSFITEDSATVTNRKSPKLTIIKVDEDTGKVILNDQAVFKIEDDRNSTSYNLLTEENLKSDSSYKFEKNGNEYISNNKGKANSKAISYIEIDLRNEVVDRILSYSVSVSSEMNKDYGYVCLTNQKKTSFNDNEKIYNQSGIYSTNPASVTLSAGQKYYLYFVYEKNGTVNSNEDCMKVTSVTLYEPFSHGYDMYVLGRAYITLPESNRIKVTEITAPKGYDVLSEPKIIENTGEDIELIIPNKKVLEVPNFTINKTDEEGKAVKGAKFEIYRVNEKQEIIDFAMDRSGRYVGDYQNGKYVSTTDYTGKIRLYLPEGYYKAVEVTAANGFILEDEETLKTIYFEIKDNQTYSCNLPEKQYNIGTVIEIRTTEEFNAIANKVNSGEENYAGKTLKLINDLDFTGKEIIPIAKTGNFNSVFRGNFDGNGHKITNVNLDYDLCLFGKIENSYIKDLTLKNCNFKASYTYGGAIREAYNSTIDNVEIQGDTYIENTGVGTYGTVAGYVKDSTVKNCTNRRNIAQNVEGKYLGGIVGKADSSKIENCYNFGNINCNRGNGYIGGIVGVIETKGWIEGCENNGNITVTSSDYTAGIVSGNSFNLTIKNCNNKANITANSGANGIAYQITNGKIIKCYNSGTISANGCTSGLVQILNDSKIENSYNNGAIMGKGAPASGLAFQINGSEIRDSYNAGHIEATGCSSGLVYETNNGKIINCYNSGEVTEKEGSSTNGAGIAYLISNNSIIMDCYNRGKINVKSCGAGIGLYITNSTVFNCYNIEEVNAGAPAGGISFSASGGIINNCYNVGKITSTGAPAGGIVYTTSSNSSIINSYNIGAVNGMYGAGGIADSISSSKVYNSYNIGNVTATTSPAGGIARIASGNSIIENCYNTGVVTTPVVDSNTSKNIIGGIVEQTIGEAIVRNCYWVDTTAESAIFLVENSANVINVKPITLRQTQFEEFAENLNSNRSSIVSDTQLSRWQYNKNSNPTLISTGFIKENKSTIVNRKQKEDTNNITIKKVDAETGNLLNGAIFNVSESKKDQLVKNSSDAFRKENGNYYIKADDMTASTIDGYVKLDLTGYSENIIITVNAETKHNLQYYGTAYAVITNDTSIPSEAYIRNNAFLYIQSGKEKNDYTTVLTPREVYYLHIGYIKNNSTGWSNRFIINDISMSRNTDETVNGKTEIKVNNGKYQVKEIKSPTGYLIDEKSYYTVIENNDIDLTIKDVKEESYTINKVNEDTNQPIQGAKFAIYELENNLDVKGFAKDSNGNYKGTKENIQGIGEVYTFTTNENGKINVSLPNGLYKAVEVQPAYGYKLEKNEFIFEINKSSTGLIDSSNEIFEVNYIEDLLEVYNRVKKGDTFEGKTVKLMRDLDFEEDDSYFDPNAILGVYLGSGPGESIKNNLTSDYPYTVGIGRSDIPFRGTFDGNNKIIKNYRVPYSGFFSYIDSATIKNMTFSNIKNNSGMSIIMDASNSTIENIKITDSTFAVSATGILVNNANKCNIKNIDVCNISVNQMVYGIINNVNNSNVSDVKVFGNNNINQTMGGVIINEATNTVIKNCGNESDIQYSNSIGVIARMLNDSLMYNCYNKGNFTGGSYIGLVYYSKNSKIIKCYNLGNLNASSLTGAIAYYAYNNSLIEDCYNTGNVTTPSFGGGIVCSLYESTVNNCYNTGEISGESGYIAGIASTASKSKIINSYNKGNLYCGNNHYNGGITASASSQTDIINCWNSGSITANNGIAAGITATLDSTSRCINCYNIGEMEGKTEEWECGITSSAMNTDNMNIINTYYLNTTANRATASAEDLQGSYEAITQEQLVSRDFAQQLNNNLEQVESNIKLFRWKYNEGANPTLVAKPNVIIGTSSYTVTNKVLPERQLTITKIDKDTQEQLAGAEIKLEKVEGDEGSEKYTTVDTYTSSATEPITENIYSTYKYRITETKAPKGYAISSEPIIVNAGTEAAEVVIENEKIPTFGVKVHHYLEGTQGDEPVKLQEDQTATLNNGDYYVIFSKDKDKTDYQDEYYEIKPSDELLKKYELISTVTQNEAEGNILEDIEVTYYYQIKEHNLTTKVEIPEGRTEKGGTISGDITIEGNEEYEKVQHNENSTKDIKITPNKGYRVKEVRLVSTTSAGKKTETIVYGENAEPTSEVKARLRKDGSMILTKFVEMTEDKEVIVVFEPDEGTVIVHHYIEGTTQKIHKDEITKDSVGTVVETNPVENETYLLVQEPEDKNPEITKETKELTYYYNVAYKITTDVIEHTEGIDNHKVKGGSISGEDKDAYEIVIKDRNNTKEIVMKPQKGYEVVKVKIDGKEIDFKEYKDDYGTVKLPKDYFEKVQKDIHVEVEYRKAARIIVKYLEEETEKVLYKTEKGKDQIVISGHDGDEFTTEHKIIPGYVDSSLGITDDNNKAINTHKGVKIVDNAAQGTMKEDELTIIYWYKKIPKGVIVRHIEINEKGETTELDNEVINDEDATEVQTERNTYKGYISVDGKKSTNKNITVVDSSKNEFSVVPDGNVVKEVWYYYEKQYKVTTEVKPHIEKDKDGNEVKVDGGTISKEYKKDSDGKYELDSDGNKIEIPYEEILNRGDSTKKITITPDDIYRVKYIKVNGKEINFEKYKVKDSEEVILPEKYFKDVQENKHIVVEFEKIPAKVIVKYLDVQTEEEIIEDKVIEGNLKDSYNEERVDVEGYVPASPEPENSKGKMTKETITIIYYYDKEFKITTDVKEHEEPKEKTIIDVIIEKIEDIIKDDTDDKKSDSEENQKPEPVKIMVKGGSITGELTEKNDKPVEKVLRGKDNTKQVEMKPDENYRIKSITVYEGEKDDKGNYSGDIYEIDVEEITLKNGKIIIPEKYFKNMQSDKHIVVEYERIPAKVIVNYKEKATEEDLAKQLTGKGFVGDKYITHEQEIPYYELLKDELPENAEGVLVEKDTIVNYWYRRLLFNMKLKKEFTSVQVNGKEMLSDDKKLIKIDIQNTEFKQTNITVKYKILVKNTEEIEGKAIIAEQIPVGFKFVNAKEEGWTQKDGKYLKTTDVIEPGKTVEYEVILEWDTNKRLIGNLENIARIADTENTPKFEETTLEDNQDSCMLIISIKTGEDRSTKKVISIICFSLAGMLTVYYIGSEIYFKRKEK